MRAGRRRLARTWNPPSIHRRHACTVKPTEFCRPARIRLLSAKELIDCEPQLTAMLVETVAAGFPLGFLAPLRADHARRYWLSLLADVEIGSRIVLAAFRGDQLVGTGQLSLPPWPNAWHRAEIHKLMVRQDTQGLGVGRALMVALHKTAILHGRSLLLLTTRFGTPTQRFYRNLGYREVGVVPGYAVGVNGERFDSVTMFQELSA